MVVVLAFFVGQICSSRLGAQLSVSVSELVWLAAVAVIDKTVGALAVGRVSDRGTAAAFRSSAKEE